MKPDNFYHLKYADYCLHIYYYTLNISGDTPFGFFQVYYIKLGSLHRTSNWTLYLIHGADDSNFINHNQVQGLR